MNRIIVLSIGAVLLSASIASAWVNPYTQPPPRPITCITYCNPYTNLCTTTCR